MHSAATQVDPWGAFSKLQQSVKAQSKERWTFLLNTVVWFLQVPRRAIRKLKVAQQQQHFLHLVQEDGSILGLEKCKVMLAEQCLLPAGHRRGAGADSRVTFTPCLLGAFLKSYRFLCLSLSQTTCWLHPLLCDLSVPKRVELDSIN